MVPFNPSIGEFRVHYVCIKAPWIAFIGDILYTFALGLNFLIQGLGMDHQMGRDQKLFCTALEVRGYDVPFILEHNQIV